MRMIPQAQRPADAASAVVGSSAEIAAAAAAAAAADDSGYSTERSSTEGSGNGAGGNITSSSDSDYPFFTDDDDFENVQERIEYISQKQEILSRASNVLLHDQEESYNAANAREASRTPQELRDEFIHQDECTIWGEAKEILRQISSKSGETEQVAAAATVLARPASTTTSGIGGRGLMKRSAAAMTNSTFLHHAKSRGEINLTGVNHVASMSYDMPPRQDEETNIATENEQQQQQQLIAKLPTVAFGKGQWMAQALVWMSSSSSASSQRKEVSTDDSDSSSSNNNNDDDNVDSSTSTIINPQDCQWKVISDPFTCSLGLVPPSNISIQHWKKNAGAVNIEEAIAFTNEARLVTQATPPFCVVFVNKAFLLLAGGLLSKESLIGKPVESILIVPQDFLFNNNNNNNNTNSTTTTTAAAEDSDNNADSSSSSLHCILNDHACRMQVVPVLDRFKRRRLSMSSYACMSHLMIRIHDTNKKVVTIAEVLPSSSRRNNNNKVVRINESNNNNLQQQQHGGAGGNHRGGGGGGSDGGDKLLGTVG